MSFQHELGHSLKHHLVARSAHYRRDQALYVRFPKPKYRQRSRHWPPFSARCSRGAAGEEEESVLGLVAQLPFSLLPAHGEDRQAAEHEQARTGQREQLERETAGLR